MKLKGCLAGALVVLAAGCGGAADRQTLPAGGPLAAPAGDLPELAMSLVVTGNPPSPHLGVVNIAGSVMRSVTAGRWAHASRPSWSPDGGKLAFGGATGRKPDNGSRSDIFVVAAGGGPPRRLTSTGRAGQPVWSPDGSTIVFAEWIFRQGSPPTARLWRMSTQGRDRRPLLEAESGRTDIPSSFSPDGTQLAFTRCTWRDPERSGGILKTCAVYLLDLPSLELRRLAERAEDAAFSPDGTAIAYASDRDENGELSYGDMAFHAYELYVMDADGTDARRLTRTRDLNERAPSWSPDGRLIAYQRGQVTGNAEGSMVLTVRPDGSCPRAVAFDPAFGIDYRDPAWRPGRPLGTRLECLSAPARPALVPLTGNTSVAQARRFRKFALYWVGRRFETSALRSISRLPVYGSGGAGQAVFLEYGAFQIQLWPACVRVPTGIYDRLEGRIRLRGVDGFLFQGRRRLELVTRRTTVVIFGEREQIVRVATALRPLNPAFWPGRGDRLAPPTPGALTGDLACGW